MSFCRCFADDDLLGHDFVVNGMVATDVLQQHLTCPFTHEVALVNDGRKLRSDVGGMHIVGKADEGHVLWNAEVLLLDSGKGSKGDNVVEGENGVRTVFSFRMTE